MEENEQKEVSTPPKSLSIGEFQDVAKRLIREQNLLGAISYIGKRLGPVSATQLFNELRAEVEVEDQINRDILVEGLNAEADDPKVQEFHADGQTLEELRSQGIIATEDEDDDPDEEDNPYLKDPGAYGGALDLEE